MRDEMRELTEKKLLNIFLCIETYPLYCQGDQLRGSSQITSLTHIEQAAIRIRWTGIFIQNHTRITITIDCSIQFTKSEFNYILNHIHRSDYKQRDVSY